MYNHQLDTFMTTVECGSFSAAGEKLFITPSAVSQKIRCLEEHFGCALFIRTNHGIQLTEIGEYLYGEAKKMRDYSSGVTAAINEMKKQRESRIVLGISELSNPRFFYDCWVSYARHHRTCTVETTVFSSQSQLLGNKRKPDIIEHIRDGEPWQKDYSFLKLGSTPLDIAVPNSHPLAKKEKLTVEDLLPYEIVTTPDFIHCPELDSFSKMLAEKGIRSFSPKKYTQVLFTDCILNNRILQMPHIWADHIPCMIAKSVDWDYELETGLFYLNDCSSPTMDFIRYIKNEMDKD